MTAPNPAADVRQMIEDVKARHVEDPKPWYTEIDGKPVFRTSCVHCLGTWPCDAYTAATRLEQAVTAMAEVVAKTDPDGDFGRLHDLLSETLRRMAGGDGE